MTIGGETKVVMFWTASDQHSWGFGGMGVFDGSMQEFLSAPFSGMPQLKHDDDDDNDAGAGAVTFSTLSSTGHSKAARRDPSTFAFAAADADKASVVMSGASADGSK